MEKAPSVVSKEQILYRAVTDVSYGKALVSKIPLTEQYFGDYVLEAEAIRRLYATYDNPISKNSLILYTKKSLAIRNKLTAETELAVENQVNKIYSLKDEHTYLNDKSIKDAINDWSRQSNMVSGLTGIITSGKDLSNKNVIMDIDNVVKNSLAFSNAVDGFETTSLLTDNADDILKIFNTAYQDTIPLGWSDLDMYMGGGLSKGELAMVLAKSGSGKTQTLVNIAKQYVEYAKQDVIYFALEEKTARMIGRLLSLLGRAKMNQLVNFTEGHINYTRDKTLLTALQDRYKKGMLGNLTLAKSTTGEETVDDIEQYIINYGSIHGKMPDVVIIDYPSLLKNDNLNNGVGEYRAEGMLFEQIRGMADRTNTLVWVANQANRMADTADLVTSFNIEGSKQKLNTVELCVSLNQTPAEKSNGYVRFYLDKVRNATDLPDDRMIYMKVNEKGISYENETQTDRDNHEEIVKETQDNKAGKFRTQSDSNSPKMSGSDKISQINKAHNANMNQYK